MASPTYSSLTETSVTINWTTLTTNADIGGTAITSYNLYWDNGTGTTSISLSDALTTSFALTGLSGGTTYKFKVRAKNVIGYGDFSSTELSVTASAVPATPGSATVVQTSTNMVISWPEPDDGSSTITAYTIKIF